MLLWIAEEAGVRQDKMRHYKQHEKREALYNLNRPVSEYYKEMIRASRSIKRSGLWSNAVASKRSAEINSVRSTGSITT